MISWRLALAAGSLLAAFGGGYYVADLQAEAQAAEVVEQQRAVLAAARDRADKAEAKAAATRAKVEIKEKVVTREVIKYIQDPNRTVCEYDDNRMRVKQAILQAVDPRRAADDRTMSTGHDASDGQ